MRSTTSSNAAFSCASSTAHHARYSFPDQRPNKYSRPPSRANAAPSRSKNRSPAEGEGSRRKPAPSTIGSISTMGRFSVRCWCWTRAWPANAVVGLSCTPGGLERHGHRHLRRGGQCRHALRDQLDAMRPPGVGDVRQVIIRASTAFAPPRPHADLTGVHGFRVVVGDETLVSPCYFLRQRPSDHPVVGGIVGNAIRLDHDGRDDREGFGDSALHAAQHVGVGGQLKDGAPLGLARQLGVVRFVRPGAQRAGRFNTAEDVGVACYVVTLQSRLNNHVHAGPHRFQREPGRFIRTRPITRACVRNARSLGSKRLDVRLLVIVAVLLQDRGVWVRRCRSRQQLLGNCQVEARAVAAGEEVREVRGRESELAVENAHLRSVVYPPMC